MQLLSLIDATSVKTEPEQVLTPAMPMTADDASLIPSDEKAFAALFGGDTTVAPTVSPLTGVTPETGEVAFAKTSASETVVHLGVTPATRVTGSGLQTGNQGGPELASPPAGFRPMTPETNASFAAGLTQKGVLLTATAPGDEPGGQASKVAATVAATDTTEALSRTAKEAASPPARALTGEVNVTTRVSSLPDQAPAPLTKPSPRETQVVSVSSTPQQSDTPVAVKPAASLPNQAIIARDPGALPKAVAPPATIDPSLPIVSRALPTDALQPVPNSQAVGAAPKITAREQAPQTVPQQPNSPPASQPSPTSKPSISATTKPQPNELAPDVSTPQALEPAAGGKTDPTRPLDTRAPGA
ncbi:MAG: hypothetical protein AAF762_03055, partial [Pseudomonadota bacterium]